MASLTPAALVSRLEEDMRSGSIPPLGLQMSMDNALELLAAGMQPYTDPNVEVLMVGAPGVAASFQGIDGLFAAWRDWGRSFQALDVVFDEVAQVPAGALLLVRQLAVSLHGAMSIEQPSAVLLRLHDGRIATVEFHLDRALAQQAAATEDRG
jgi:hypothetical protein